MRMSYVSPVLLRIQDSWGRRSSLTFLAMRVVLECRSPHTRAGDRHRRSCTGWSTLHWRARAPPISWQAEPQRATAWTLRYIAEGGFLPSHRRPRQCGTFPPSPGISRRDRPVGCAGPGSAKHVIIRRVGPLVKNVVGESGRHQPDEGTVSGLPVFC